MNNHSQRRKNNESVDEAFRLYADMVCRIAFLRTRSMSDAEDVTQEVFLRYIRSAPGFSGEEHRKAWLARVALNCTSSLLHSAWRSRTVPQEELENLGFAEDEPEYGVYAAVLSLPVRYRTVVHLYYYEGWRVSDIAEILGTREGTVKSQLSRAREMLRERLKEEI